MSGLDLATLARRIGADYDRLRFLLDAEIVRGRVKRDDQGRYMLNVGAFTPATLRALRTLGSDREKPAA